MNCGTLKIRWLQCYEVLWIHNINAICISSVECDFQDPDKPRSERSPSITKRSSSKSSSKVNDRKEEREKSERRKTRENKDELRRRSSPEKKPRTNREDTYIKGRVIQGGTVIRKAKSTGDIAPKSGHTWWYIIHAWSLKCISKLFSIVAFLDNGLWKFQLRLYFIFLVISSLIPDRIQCKGYADVLLTKKGRKMGNKDFKIQPVGIRTLACAWQRSNFL